MWLKHFAPNSFLGKFPLKLGAKYIGIFMCCVSAISVIVFSSQLFYYKQCHNCTQTVLHDVYTFSIHAITYCLCIFFVNLWFIWGVKHKKASIVLTWVVVTTMWWLQGSIFILILMCINITEMSVGWIATLCIAIIGFVVFAYCILVGYAYWLEIKNRALQDARTVQTSEQK